MEDPKVQQWTYGNYSCFVDCTSNYQEDVKTCESGPDIRLTELEQQLEVAETRCGSLKSQLDYMKMLYQGVQPCSSELFEAAEAQEEVVEEGEKQEQEQGESEKAAVKLLLQKSQHQLNIVADESLENRPVEFIEKKESCDEDNPASEDVKYYQFLEEIQRMHEMTKEDAERTSPKQSSQSSKTTPRIGQQHFTPREHERESISAEYRHVKQIRKTYTLQEPAAEEVDPESSSLPVAPTLLQTSEISTQVCKEHDVDDATAMRDSCDYLTEYSTCLEKNLAIASNLMGQSVSEKKYELESENGVFQREERRTRKHDLVLKLTESVNSIPTTVKRKKIPKFDKKQKPGTSGGSAVKRNSSLKYDDSLSVTSKSKRKKGKLRSANSKNTVMAREMNLSDRRDLKKRKHKGHSSATRVPHQLQAPLHHVPHVKAEIVEIYHNNAVEGGSGSVSVSSSKQLKHEVHCQQQSRNTLPKKENLGEMSSAEKRQDQLAQQQQQQQQQQSCASDKKLSQEQNETRALVRSNNQKFQKGSSRSHQKSRNNYGAQDSNDETAQSYSFAQQQSGYYDPTITRNYELPTVASKLKKVNRSYFKRFNFRNIPFVVSTSVTPSHNLGLNIQQVLSIMKTRQPMTTGITPLLIRKMSKGIKPISELLDRTTTDPYSIKSPRSSMLDRQFDNVSCGRRKTPAECAESVDESFNKSKCTSRHEHLSAQEEINLDGRKLQDRFLEKEEKQDINGCICCPKQSKSYNKMLKQYSSRKSIGGNPTLTASALLKEREEEINIGDNHYNKMKDASGSSKGIREVLVNLHDQFEELNLAYEKLQEKATKSNDISIKKQISVLEKELNAKEVEINAVVGLYKEVLQLKQQVNSINGKNSFVCITTGYNPSSPSMVPRSGVTQAQVTNPMELFNMPTSSIREPATTMRLAGLLREIQSFQKQLLAL